MNTNQFGDQNNTLDDQVTQQLDEVVVAKPSAQEIRQKVEAQPVYEAEYDEEDEYDEDDASRRAGKGCLIAILALLVLLAGVGIFLFSWYKSELAGKHNRNSTAVTVEIPTGSTRKDIGRILEDADVIGSGTVFHLYVRYLYEGEKDLKAGSYEFAPGMSYDEILALLNEGPNLRRTVTVRVPEATTVMGVANAFVDAGLCETIDEFLDVADDLERFADITVIARLLEDFDPLVFHASEGYLYPNTYEFYVDETIENIVRTMYLEMDSKFTEETYARMAELDMSVREVITLASIIQQEAGAVEQQPYVSDVIWNRLGSGWPQGTLGVDVTLKYIRQYMQWTSDEWADVPRSDISIAAAKGYIGEDLFYAYYTGDDDNATRRGLPTGPISSVLESCIQAALYPEAKDGVTYYYFLTTLQGNYYYATTWSEHQANIQIMYRENAEWEQEQGEAADDAA